MAYKRPTNGRQLSSAQKTALLADYLQSYRVSVAADPTALNRKLPRAAFSGLLDRIGEILLAETSVLARTDGDIRSFLEGNPLPSAMAELLTVDFRVFCLALNALKQWVVAEQAATDRFLFGGAGRKLFRNAAINCLVTGAELGTDCELHHPVRDGRPPIPLTKKGHTLIEGQSRDEANEIDRTLFALKRERNRSWKHLRRGCLDLLGRPEPWPSNSSANDARTFARKAAAASGVTYEQILNWLDKRHL